MSKAFEESENKNKRQSNWHGTTLREATYQIVAKLAEQHKRSVVKEIEFLIEEGLKAIGEKVR